MSQWRDVENSLRRHVLALLSGIAGFVYFYFKGDWTALAIPREWLLFALVQFTFVSWLSGVSVFAAICTYCGYIRALEDRINNIGGRPSAVWVSGVWKRFTAMPYGAFFWSSVVMNAMGCAVLLGVMIVFIATGAALWMRGLTIVELPIGVGFILWARVDLDRSEKFSRELLLNHGTSENSPESRKELI